MTVKKIKCKFAIPKSKLSQANSNSMDVKLNEELIDTQKCKQPNLSYVDKTLIFKAGGDKLIGEKLHINLFRNDRVINSSDINFSKMELISKLSCPIQTYSLDYLIDYEKVSKHYREGIYLYYYSTLKTTYDKSPLI